MSHTIRELALAYHASPQPGKIAIKLSKPANTAAE